MGWGIRDSGKPASLYAIKPAGDGPVRTREFRTDGLRNRDWEDMAVTPGSSLGTGHLWVLENVGNGWTGNRWIYQFEEPDPENPPARLPLTATAASPTTTTTSTTMAPSTTTTGLPPAPWVPSATLVGAYRWAYPGHEVNTESMFVFDGDLVVVTKTVPSRVYRFNQPLRPSVVNVPTYVGTLLAGWRLSVAAISADQRTLAVSSHGKLDVYENRGDVRDLAALIANPVFRQDMPADNREGGRSSPTAAATCCCWPRAGPFGGWSTADAYHLRRCIPSTSSSRCSTSSSWRSISSAV